MPAPDAEMSAAEALRRFWPSVRPYRWRLVLAILCAAIVPGLDALAISLYGRLLDDVLTPLDLAPLPGIAAAYLALTLAAGMFGFGRRYCSAWVAEYTLFNLRQSVFTHLQRLPSLQIDQQRVGDLITRLTDDVEQVGDALTVGITDAVSDAMKVVYYTAAVFLIDARLAVVALLVSPPCWFLARLVGQRVKVISREQRARDSAVASFVEEQISNAFLVSTHNRQAAAAQQFAQETRAVLNAQLGLERLRALYSPLIDLIEVAGVLIVVAVGAFDLVQGRITLGGLLVFLAFLGSLYAPLRSLTHAWHDTASALASAERIAEVLHQQPDTREASAPRRLPRVNGALELLGVGYSYPGQELPALRDVSLTIPEGASVAIVGASGAGKSTIARLLLRMADPDTGQVTLDGIDLRALALEDAREAITLLPQEPLFFTGTIHDAIRYGRPAASMADVVRAAEVAGAAVFIEQLPDGYETRLETRARNLSGGQRQRLAIARALLRDAPVLILDEPTTGLDAAQAAEVLGGIQELMAGRTTITISHDLALLRNVDAIVVLDGGRIVERGTHDQLMLAGGVYATLCHEGRAHLAGPQPGHS
ncbi:MAG: ABC transporter ATP-binding protein [Thermomicrobiales bacterium]